MQTFLPSGYSFSPDKLLDPELIPRIQRMRYANGMNLFAYLRPFEWAIFIIGSIFLLLIFLMYINVYSENKKVISAESFIAGFFWISWNIIMLAIMSYRDFYKPKQEYYTATFEYSPKSNLHVKMTNDKFKPKSINDQKECSYIICASDDTELGKMNQGKFMPFTSKRASTFYKYYTYINKHHLEDKFAKKVVFKKDDRYTTTYANSQWILTNNKDTVLHLKDNSIVEQTNVVKDCKERK